MPKTESSTSKIVRRRPARTAKGRENQLIKLAIDLAETQLLNGTASAQVITHFLKLATTKEQLENEKLRSDLAVAKAKIKQIESGEDIKILYQNALAAMKSYGSCFNNEGEEYDENDR